MQNRKLLELEPDHLLKQEVANDLDAQSLINLARTNKCAYGLFKPASIAYQYIKKFVERSAKTQMSALLAQSRNFNITINQLHHAVYSALRLGDIDLVKVIMKGREDEFKQIELPNKLIDNTYKYDFSYIVEAIESNDAVKIEEALTKFRAELDQMVKEKGFPFQALLDALMLYQKKYREWSPEQCKIFSIKVIGYLQRLSPAWLKKAYANAWDDVDSFMLASGESIDPAADVANKGLGFEFCVNVFGRKCIEGLAAKLNIYLSLYKYLDRKNDVLEFIKKQVNAKACKI